MATTLGRREERVLASTVSFPSSGRIHFSLHLPNQFQGSEAGMTENSVALASPAQESGGEATPDADLVQVLCWNLPLFFFSPVFELAWWKG